jgi:hypothetical protein
MALIDLGDKTTDKRRGRAIAPRRHIQTADGGGLACGHLPSADGLVQVPLFLRDFIKITDCKKCKEFAQSVLDGGSKRMWERVKVEVVETPASNTGVNSENG